MVIHLSIQTQRADKPMETNYLRVSFISDRLIHTVVTVKDQANISATAAPRTISQGDDAQRETDADWSPEWNAISSATGAVYTTHSSTFRFPLVPGVTYRADYEMHRPR